MEGFVFWLVPVILLVIFTIVLANHARDPKRRKLLFIEPLGWLVKAWRPVRFVGDRTALTKALNQLVAARLSDGSAFEATLVLDGVATQPTTDSIEHRSLGAWSTQRIIVQGSQTVSLVAGEVGIVLTASRYQADGRTLLTDSDRAEVELTAKRAGEHGYLALAIASRHFHSRVFEPDKHTWLGLVFLEPIIDERLTGQLSHILPNRWKFLSVLPTELLLFLRGQSGPTSHLAGIPERPSADDPRSLEEHWERSTVIGAADGQVRHAVTRYFESRRDCRFLTSLESDQSLPIHTTDKL